MANSGCLTLRHADTLDEAQDVATSHKGAMMISTNATDIRAKLSTLWVFVMLNMIFADIFSFMTAGFLQELSTGYAGGIRITQGFLLGAAIVTEIPIAMVILSRVLKPALNRWANIIAGVITIAYVIGGGSVTLHYLFIASVEVVCTAYIVWSAWTWRTTEGNPRTIPLDRVEYGKNS